MATYHSSLDEMLHEKNSLLNANRMEATGNSNIVRHQYGGIAMNGCSGDQYQAEKGVAESNTAPLVYAATLPHLSVLGLCNIVRPSSTPAPSTDLRDSARIDTVIIAPAEADLPPGTPLLGSSKLVANARSNELRRSRSSSSMTLNHSSSFAYLRKMGSFMRRKSDLDRGAISTMEISCNETTTTTTPPTTAILVKSDACTLEEVETQYRSNFEQAHTHTSFFQDALNFAEGTIPQSIVIALVIGCICGVVAYMYYSTLNFLLTLMWKDMPNYVFAEKYPNIPESLHILWIPIVTFTMSFFCGLSIYFLGEPGDLAYTIQCVHEQGYKATHHIVPMIAASMFTILAGASLGPEAPLVAICAATAGFVSRSIFHQKNKNVVRKHTFMGMAGALSAFFGVPLGGSIFALEVTSRFGIEYFEHLMEAILAGEICVAVFRSLTGLPLGSIWRITPTRLVQAEPYMILLGGGIGLLGAFVAYIWANLHWRLMDCVRMLGLMDDENRYAVPRVMLGALGIVATGMIVPQTMFWGEFEFPVLATLSPASELPHVWPTAGLIGFEMNSCTNCVIAGICRLLAISLTVAGGYRGGFIFPFFTVGAAFGRALCFIFPTLSPSIATLCMAAGINVAITRTALATSLILSFLSGEQFALPVVVAASIVSLFATGYVPFIKSQLVRSDIDFSLYYKQNRGS